MRNLLFLILLVNLGSCIKSSNDEMKDTSLLLANLIKQKKYDEIKELHIAGPRYKTEEQFQEQVDICSSIINETGIPPLGTFRLLDDGKILMIKIPLPDLKQSKIEDAGLDVYFVKGTTNKVALFSIDFGMTELREIGPIK